MNRFDFIQKKKEKEKITMVTCYDYWSACLLNETPVDTLLVGDSLAMVMHGHNSTLPATNEMMALHTQAVAKGAPKKFIVADMPFLSTRKSLSESMHAVDLLMKAGASAIKIEGAAGHFDLIKHIVESGVPVMGHLGLTPQSIHQLGGFKVQGKNAESEDQILTAAKSLQDAGAFSLVLECVPTELAQKISQQLEIPTIGIGAGLHTDGQVLVLQDLLGLNTQFKPKFLRHFAQGAEWFKGGINEFCQSVKNESFPSQEESY